MELWAAVDAVEITTKNKRFSFPVEPTADGRGLGVGKEKDPKLDHGYVFNQGRFQMHWRRLCDWVINGRRNKASAWEKFAQETIKYGVGAG